MFAQSRTVLQLASDFSARSNICSKCEFFSASASGSMSNGIAFSESPSGFKPPSKPPSVVCRFSTVRQSIFIWAPFCSRSMRLRPRSWNVCAASFVVGVIAFATIQL